MVLLLIRTAQLRARVCQDCQAPDKTSVHVEGCSEEIWDTGVIVTHGFLVWGHKGVGL